jgi:hypothetical protein
LGQVNAISSEHSTQKVQLEEQWNASLTQVKGAAHDSHASFTSSAASGKLSLR